MNKHLQQLVELSSIDKEISSYIPKVETAEQELSVAQANFDEINNQINKLINMDKDLLVKIGNNESYIDELNEKLEHKQITSASLTTDKEIQSINIEMDIAKEQITFANEEIGRFENYIITNKEKIEELQEEIKSFEEALKTQTQITNKTIQEIDNEKSKVQSRRDKVQKNVNIKVFDFYENIRKWAGDSAIVPIKRQACYGCHLVVNEQTYSAVLLSDDIITCQSCGRIVYLPEIQADTEEN